MAAERGRRRAPHGGGMRPPTQPRHVLLTADAVGGVWTWAIDLATALADRGVETTLAVLGPAPDAAQRRAAAAIPGLTLIETGLPLDWVEDDPARLAAAGRRLASLAASAGVDLVHLNSPALAAEAAFPVPVVGGCHSCLATWWSAVRGDAPMPEAFRWRTAMLAEGYAACDRLIAPSAAFAAATAERYGVRVEAVHNGRAPAPARSATGRDAVVLTSGRLWDEGKNVAGLDRAAARMVRPVRAAGPLTGPGGAGVALAHAVPLGRLDAAALREELDRASVFASLALYEPFGLGVLEAAQAGCALVLSDIPSFRELWHGAATFAPVDDAAALARTLDDLLAAPDATESLGRAAAARAARFTPEAMADGVLAVWREVLADRAACAGAAA